MRKQGWAVTDTPQGSFVWSVGHESAALGTTTMAEKEELLALRSMTLRYPGWGYVAAGHFRTRDRILSDWRAGK